MIKQLQRIGMAFGVFLALAYLAYAFTDTLRVGAAYVFGTSRPEQTLRARRREPPQEPAAPEPTLTTPAREEKGPEPVNRWANRAPPPVPPAQGRPPVPASKPAMGKTVAAKPRTEKRGPSLATYAYRGPTYDEMRNKLDRAQRTPTMDGCR